MFLVLTDPHLEDAKSYHNLTKDEAIRKEFANLRNSTPEWVEAHIRQWMKTNVDSSSDWLKLIKLVNVKSTDDHYNDNNSTLIGFISLNEAGPSDALYSGFKVLLNFGIMQQFRGKGLMTMALKMRLQRLYELEYNIAAAFISGSNPESEKVLTKCGFDKIRDTDVGKSYVKRLYIDEQRYKTAFGIG